MDDTQKASPLVKKLAEIIHETTRVEKRGHNDFHNYDYATAADVLDAVRKGLASRHIVIVPRITAVDVKEKAREGKSPQFITTTQQTYAIMDGESGEVLEVPWYGCGEDSGDKGIYKALTGGNKYFLLQLFMIPTGDDPERDRPRKGVQQSAATAAPVSADAAAIAVIAAELQQFVGSTPEKLIRDASWFKDDKGKERFFTDPTKVASAKWLAKVKDKLQGELTKQQALREPGVEEAAAALT